MKINARDKRIIIAGAVVIVAVAIFYAMTNLQTYGQNLADKVDKLRTKLSSQGGTIKQEEVYRSRIDQLNKRLDQDMTLLLPGDSPSVAGAELLKLLKEFADQSKVVITSRSNLPEKKVQDLSKVSARVETNCNMEQLVDFLARIESHPRYLKIEELMINSFRMPAQKKYEIRPGMVVAGYIHAREEKPSAKPATPAKKPTPANLQ